MSTKIMRGGLSVDGEGLARRVGGLVYANTAAATAITGATETDAMFDKSISIPANTLKAGSVIRVRAQGIHTATTGAETHTIALKLGSTALVSHAAVDPATNDVFVFDFAVVVRTAGASGTMVGAGFSLATGAAATGTMKAAALASTAVDTTAALVVGVWIDRQASATDADSARLDVLTVEIVA
jgi:hypothetical protein